MKIETGTTGRPAPGRMPAGFDDTEHEAVASSGLDPYQSERRFHGPGAKADGRMETGREAPVMDRDCASTVKPASSHRWPRATTSDERWGPLCECGNLKTDQALTCNDCAVERRRAPDHWERRRCPICHGRKTKDALMCRRCRNEMMRGVPQPKTARAQAVDHPWRKDEAVRIRKAA